MRPSRGFTPASMVFLVLTVLVAVGLMILLPRMLG